MPDTSVWFEPTPERSTRLRCSAHLVSTACFFSYSLSMIPDWRGAIDRGWAAVAPGGSLHIVDFGQCENLLAASGY